MDLMENADLKLSAEHFGRDLEKDIEERQQVLDVFSPDVK